MTTVYDVIVVGGGPVGAACARELAASGRKVLLLDKGGEHGEAWRASAGMLAAQIEAQQDDPLFELGLAGRERYQELAGLLGEETGIDIGLRLDGIAHVAADENEAITLKSKVAWQRQQGHLVDWFDAGEVRSRWPWLSPTEGALWAAGDGSVDPVRLVQALLADAERHGTTVVRDEVNRLELRGDRVVGVVGTDSYASSDVVLAAGAWSGRIGNLPRPLSVEPIRGQMAALPWPAGAEPAVVYGKGCYLLARNGEGLTGSTMEHAGFRPETTAAGLARVFTAVSALCPTLASAEVTRTWAGLRPMTPDSLPILGPEPKAPGLWYATGHGRNGILLAGITGVILSRLMSGEDAGEQVEPFRPERFWSW